MKYIYRYWILVPLLLFAVLSRNWVEEKPDGVSQEPTINMAASQADYYLEAFETRKLSADGRPEYVVTGDALSHYPEDDRSVIIKPRLVMYREEHIWTMDSPEGVLTPDPETFRFSGDVSMVREATTDNTPQGGAIRLQTRDVWVRTEENRVHTDQPVTVTSERWKLRSIGLESDIDAGILTLLSNVTARYEVN